MNAKRGYVPEDERNFSAEALETMRTASRHISYLINEGYDLKQASGFVGNHFMLSELQRLAIMRSLATDSQLNLRREKQVGLAETSKAIHLMCDLLHEAKVEKVNILLDQPVSNSGRLKARIADIAEGAPFDLDIQVRTEVDRELYIKENVITSDSVVLDHCISWINLMEESMKRQGIHGIQVW